MGEAGKSGKAQRFTMSRFSDTLAVVCYTPFGDQVGVPVCRTLTVAGDELDAGAEFEFVPNSTTDVYSMSLATLTEDRGVLCVQDTSGVTNYNERHVVCTILQVSGESLSVPARIYNGSEFLAGSGWIYVNDARLDNVQVLSLAALSETAAFVCYNDGTGLPPNKVPTTFCNKLTITGDSLFVGGAYELGAGRNWPANSGSKAVSVAAVSDTDGIACLCNDDEGPVCTPLDLIQDDIKPAGEPLQIGDAGDRCREVTVVAMPRIFHRPTALALTTSRLRRVLTKLRSSGKTTTASPGSPSRNEMNRTLWPVIPRWVAAWWVAASN